MAKMTKNELRAIVGSEIANSYGADSGELQGEIAKAIDYYLGEPFGNEEDGQSQVVSTDVQDVIEWIMPSLMRIFASTEKAVVFDPTQAEDEEQADQETDVVNYAFYKENDGFLTLYSWFKDALLSKNGIAKVWWDPTKKSEREEYKDLVEKELIQLLSDPDVEPLEHTETNGLHDIAIERTTSKGNATVEVIPIEEYRISKDASCIFPHKARFNCHKTYKTRSELIQMGFPKRKVNSLAHAQYDDNEIELSRRNLEDDTFSRESSHESTQTIEVYECYYRVDFDGDGIAELRQITMAGNEILINEPTDRVPFVAITPVILTHKFFGLSIADLVMDLQLIKSTLLRGVLNNTYLANNPRTAVQDGMVNLDDLLTNRSGGVVRTLGPPGAVLSTVPHTPIPPQTFELLEKMDGLRKERTGVSQDTMGLEANVLAHGRTGVINQSFDMAQMRIELIARIFAEIGLKPLFRELHAILQKNQDKSKWMKLRGQWVPINPTEWKTRYNMSVNVGLGTGNKDKQLQFMSTILGIQKELLPTGRGVTEQNVYNTLEKLVELGGLNDVNQYFTDPSTQPPPQPKQDPNEMLIQAQIQLTQAQVQTAQTEAETNRQEAIWKHEEKMTELQLEDQRKRYEIELGYQRNVPGGLASV